MMEYEYLISYIFKGGSGSICIITKIKINTIDRIAELNKYIEKETKQTNVGINSYQLIRKYKRFKGSE